MTRFVEVLKIVIVVELLSITVGLMVFIQHCQEKIKTYGSSDVVKSVDTACWEEEECREVEVAYEVTYECTKYYTRTGDFVYEECDEPVEPSQVDVDDAFWWENETIWEEPEIVEE